MSDQENKCPLTGEQCLFHKSLQITDIIGGVCNEAKCCQKCGDKVIASLNALGGDKKASPDSPMYFPPSNMMVPSSPLLGLLNYLMRPKPEAPPPVPSCPSCGTTTEDIRRRHRLGCPQCYEKFKMELQSTILTAQGGAYEHVGKKPLGKPDTDAIRVQLARLEQKMAEAVGKEEYENAATIRDAIADLRKRLEGS